MATRANVFPQSEETFPRSLFGKPSRNAYRAAIKRIILDLKASKGLSDWELAEHIGCHKDTIENAQEMSSSLDVVTLLNVAYAFGEEAIDPVRQLYLCAPVDSETKDEKRRRLIRELAALEDA
jgi:DNA-directed RNA polymerase specialized sigma subunit